MELPLIIRIDVKYEGQLLEFIVGEEEVILERAGEFWACNITHMLQYTTLPTRKINSFYSRAFDSGKKNLRKLIAREKVWVQEGDEIGWGYEEPLIMMKPYDIIDVGQRRSKIKV